MGDLGSIPGLGKSPGGGHGNPLQYSCLENPHGQKSLAGYSPWGHRVGHDSVTKHRKERREGRKRNGEEKKGNEGQERRRRRKKTSKFHFHFN